MARHFGPQHAKNGYAAMGGSRKQPKYPQRVRAEPIKKK